ncbi:MAG: hypothetical protein IKY33_03685 [Clostridia bacterium]|nr:hypothetical protein [Clostridia bacterium]
METAPNTHPSKKRMALTFCIGLAFIGLVIWLIISLIVGVVGLFRADVYSEGVDTNNIAAASALYDQLSSVEADSEEYFEILLDNFVMQDVPSFTSINELDSEYLISFGLWQAITLNNSQGVLASGEDGQAYRVPKRLVEKLANYYTDYTESYKHRNMTVCGDFTYNRLNGTYTVPISYPTEYLIPNVVEITLDEENQTAQVTVDCYQNNDVDEDPLANEANFRKREVYTLKKVTSGDENELAYEELHYQIVSMRQVEKIADKEE